MRRKRAKLNSLTPGAIDRAPAHVLQRCGRKAVRSYGNCIPQFRNCGIVDATEVRNSAFSLFSTNLATRRVMATKKKTRPAVSTSPTELKTAAELRRKSRLYRIVRAFASGATVTEIAQAENIGRTLASRFVNSPESQQILAQFVQNELDLMLELFLSLARLDHLAKIVR